MKFNEKKTSCLYNVCLKIPRNEKPFDWNKETKERKNEVALFPCKLTKKLKYLNVTLLAIAISNDNFRTLNKIGWASGWGKVEIIY